MRIDTPDSRLLGQGLVGGIGLLGLAIVAGAFSAEAIDFAVYRAGGAAVLSSTPLYDRPVLQDVSFVYTPFAALLFTPFALLPAVVAQATWVVANYALLVFVAWRSWQSIAGLRGRVLIAAVVVTASVIMLTEAVHTTFYVGQINLVLLALVVADLMGSDGRRTRGIGVGIAAGIKLTPLFFVLYLLVLRQLRAAAVAAGTFAGTILTGFALLPGDFMNYWLKGAFADSGRIYADLRSTHNQSIRGLVLRSGLSETGVLGCGALLRPWSEPLP